MRLGKSANFIYQAITAGLAVAFVVLVFFPDLLGRSPVVEVRESAAPTLSPEANARLSDMGPVSYADAVAAASPAVINIQTAKLVTQRRSPLFDDPFFRHFFGDMLGAPRKRLETSLGSGVIISAQGYILTNNHVIDGADEIQVMLQDGREAQAKVVGTDPDTDLAVLMIDLDQLPTITISNSDSLRVGDVALAIGNPFGVGQTVTIGIVSATGRSHLGINTFEDFIQTDAAINPGNSGGALINPYGHLIGINTAIFSRSGGSQGIGFAIPVTLAKDVMRQIIEQGYVARGWLGIEVQEITPALAESFGLRHRSGVLIAGVLRDSPGDTAGLEPGDIITHVRGRPVADPRDAINAIAYVQPGNPVDLQVVRAGKTRTIMAAVSQRPAQASRR